MRKRDKMIVIVGITLIFLVALSVAIYVVAINAEPYKVALDFIDRNGAISEELGHLTNKRLHFFGYSVSGGPHGWAEYEISVNGETGKGNVYLHLEKTAGTWQVTQGRLVACNNKITSLTKQAGAGQAN